MSNGHIWLTDSGILFSLWDANAAAKMHDRGLNTLTLQRHAFYLHFKEGSFKNIQASGIKAEVYYNYFYGNDASKWASEIHPTDELLVKELYPGIDLRLFSDGNTLKYNLECAPGADIAAIRMQYIGVNDISVTNDRVNIYTSVQNLSESIPLVYEEVNGQKTPITSSYRLINNELTFNLSLNKGISHSRIIIDPVLEFSTYSGSKADNFGCTGTYDDLGNGYAGGTVFGPGLPLSLGAFQTSFGGGTKENLGYGDGRDAAILKFSPDGKKLLFGTYLGGNNNEQPHSMVTTATGDLYVMGSTRSSNFPVTGGCYKNSNSGDYDFFISKISPDGKQLLASTYIGGSGLDAVGADREAFPINDFPLLYNYADEFRGEIITDGNAVYVSGTTYSINFPRSNNSGWFGGKEDGCLFSLSSDLTTLNWAQLVGKSGYDAFYGVAFGKSGDIYTSGGTTSTDLPNSFPKFQNSYLGGLSDGIICRFNKTNGNMLSASYVGTKEYEQAYFVQTDNSGNPYLYGQTEGAVGQLNSPFYQKETGQFIFRLDTGLTAITLSTSFGGNDNRPNISPSAFLVDQCERIFVSGWGGEVNGHLYDKNGKKTHQNTGTTNNLPITADAFQKTTDGSDFYIAIFAKNMYTLLYSTYFGGISSLTKDAHEHVDGGTSRFDKKGIIYQAVCAGCGANNLFPTTPGAYSRTNNSENCNNALFKIDFENLNKKPVMRDTFIQVVATDIVDFTRLGIDPDPQDPVDAKVFRLNNGGILGNDTPEIYSYFGIGSASVRVYWQTTCKSWSKDTIYFKVMLYDKGCPKADTTYALFKILVTEPPKVTPPDNVCVSYDRATGNLKIAWPSTTQDSRFFSHFLLKRVDPDNSIKILDTVNNTLDGSFTDIGVSNPETENYCYYMEGYNTCGVMVPSIKKFCTIRELTDPIRDVRVKFATVDFDKRVRVEWESSEEPDFKEFEVYRYPRGQNAGNVPVKYTKDTVFLDTSFDVDAVSNCYRILVSDNCGHISTLSNEGCNIVIQGNATGKPQYYFDLNWQDYESWQNGVNRWILERQYKNYPWTSIATTTSVLMHRDDKLDFDWGGYWYRVTAVEYIKAQPREPDSSQSNWIYLFQPPEVYVPSGITINGDNLNDVWGTVPVFVKDYQMRVYNRWGQKVWESTDKYSQWDGFVRDIQTEDGVFAWYVTFTGWDSKTYKITGTVTLLH